jgi:nucleoside phosphorylase
VFRIVLTFALTSEFAPWRRMAGFRRVNGNGIPVYSMHNRDAEVCAVITGIGTRSVKSELRDLFRKQPGVCIASGLAGSLRGHAAGAILVARSVGREGNQEEIKTEESLVEMARHCGADVVDHFFTSDAVVNSPLEKSRLGKIADAVDMESFQVLRQATEHGIPSIAVRAISDASETELPMDFNRVIDERGQIAWLPALRHAASTPHRLPEWIRFGRDSARARRNLAHFLDRYVRRLAAGANFRLAAARVETR